MVLYNILLLALPALAAASSLSTLPSVSATQATRVELKERATTTAAQALQSNICGWQAGDAGTLSVCVSPYIDRRHSH